MRHHIKNMVELNNSKRSKFFALFIQLLILISIIIFSIETIPDLNPHTRKVLHYIDLFIVIIFTIEYILRIYLARHKLRFVFSLLGLIDLLAILPFYISIGVDLRALRALRFLSIFRIFKLIRYNRAIHHFIRAIRSAKEEILLFIFVTLILIFFSAVGIYYFEHEAQPEYFSSVFESLWWAVITLTTVGYGDVYPITVGGRVFTFFILMIGLGIIAIPTAIISSALTKSMDRKVEK